MGQIVLLGTANAIADEKHENTHLAIRQGGRTVLVDCVGSPLVRLGQATIPPESITDLIVTHFHPDHVAGVPVLLMDLWLLGRKTELVVHGLAHTLSRVKQMMDLYQWQSWPGFFPVVFHELPEEELTPVLEERELRILASPVKHLLPTVGLRVEFQPAGRYAAYTCDTEPCSAVDRLAHGVDVLIHESAGASLGHSSARQAGETASRAEVGRLVLVHYPREAHGVTPDTLLTQAQGAYAGPVVLGLDLMAIDLD